MNFSLCSVIVFVLAVLFVSTATVLGITVYYPMVQERNALIEKRNDLIRMNEAMAKETADLKRKQAMFKDDPAFVEVTAREANQARADEVVFVFEK